jgi:hypothetical protein
MIAVRSERDELGPSSTSRGIISDWRVLHHGANVTKSSGQSFRAIVTALPRRMVTSLSSPTLQKP